jgi:hypothetical protein
LDLATEITENTEILAKEGFLEIQNQQAQAGKVGF